MSVSDKIIGLSDGTPSRYYMYFALSERHAEPGTLPRVCGTTRNIAFLGSFLVLARAGGNVSLRLSTDHWVERRLGEGDRIVVPDAELEKERAVQSIAGAFDSLHAIHDPCRTMYPSRSF